MTTGQILAVGGLGLAAIYLLRRTSPPPMVAAAPPAPQRANAGTLLQRAFGQATGAPIEAYNNLLQGSPTWLKVANPIMVGLPSVTADLIEDPIGTAKKAGSLAKSAYDNTLGRLF